MFAHKIRSCPARDVQNFLLPSPLYSCLYLSICLSACLSLSLSSLSFCLFTFNKLTQLQLSRSELATSATIAETASKQRQQQQPTGCNRSLDQRKSTLARAALWALHLSAHALHKMEKLPADVSLFKAQCTCPGGEVCFYAYFDPGAAALCAHFLQIAFPPSPSIDIITLESLAQLWHTDLWLSEH